MFPETIDYENLLHYFSDNALYMCQTVYTFYMLVVHQFSCHIAQALQVQSTFTGKLRDGENVLNLPNIYTQLNISCILLYGMKKKTFV